MRASAPEIARELLLTPSAGLSLCADRTRLADRLAAVIELASPSLSLDQIMRLATGDYRAIALHLYQARRSAQDTRTDVDGSDPGSRPWVQVTSLDELKDGDGPNVLILDPRYRPEIEAFLVASGGRPGVAVESWLDVPGRNAVLRDGVVKRGHLPGATSVVAKRDNRRKTKGIIEELKNIEAVLCRLGQPEGGILPLTSGKGNNAIRIERPLVAFRDPATNLTYALWVENRTSTLEELLLCKELDAGQRTRLLRQCRLCLNALFDKGIVWRDMSPRNILVEAMGAEGLVFHLVDFEKVEIFGHPLSQSEREIACRTQFCVEEFGVVCSEAELLATFEGLFDPQRWDLQCDAPLPHAPRAELAALLAGRNPAEPVSVAAFNRLDKEVYDVRRPRIRASDGRMIQPGMLGFRVEHYLSLSPDIDCVDYDRKTTEVLLAADGADRLFAVFDLLWECLAELETAILVREFEAIVKDGDSRAFRYPIPESEMLCATIDRLLACASPEAFDAIVVGNGGVRSAGP